MTLPLTGSVRTQAPKRLPSVAALGSGTVPRLAVEVGTAGSADTSTEPPLPPLTPPCALSVPMTLVCCSDQILMLPPSPLASASALRLLLPLILVVVAPLPAPPPTA